MQALAAAMPPLSLTPALHRETPIMAKPRKIALETPTARAKLTPRKASYFVRVAPHIALGYRRNQSGFGT